MCRSHIYPLVLPDQHTAVLTHYAVVGMCALHLSFHPWSCLTPVPASLARQCGVYLPYPVWDAAASAFAQATIAANK